MPRALATIAAIIIAIPCGTGLAGAGQAGGPAALRPPAPISAVTVYPDRALVTRTARADLIAGATEIVIEGLPGATLDASVRATGRGAMSVRITGVDVSREHLVRPDDARVRALEAEIRTLQDADRALQDEIQAVQPLREYLRTVQAKATDPPKEVQTHRIDVDGIRGVYAFLTDSLGALAKRQREAEAARRDLQEQLQKIQRDLHELRAPAATLRKTVAVGVEAARPGRFELEVSYAVPGAAWAPAYEARALAETREVELTYGARVAQRTGEAWDGVALALSTARPAVGAHAPKLDPWVLHFIVPRTAKLTDAPASAVVGAARQLAQPSAAPEAARGGEADDFREKDEKAVLATADVVAGGPSVVFKIARSAHIPNDNRQHKTTVAVERFPAEFSYLAVPKRSPFAYLVARTKPRGDLPLLAGPVEIFREGDYIGRSRLDGVAPGEPFDLHLGVDEGIKVRREELARERGEAGVFSKAQRTRLAYEIIVENFKRTAETITVVDQLPVAQDQEVEVGGVRLSREATERTEQGILKWTFKLAPQEKKVIRVEFTVSHPAEKAIAGL